MCLFEANELCQQTTSRDVVRFALYACHFLCICNFDNSFKIIISIKAVGLASL